MKPARPNKLALGRDTLRNLSNGSLARVAGGVSEDTTCHLVDPWATVSHRCVTAICELKNPWPDDPPPPPPRG